MVCATLWHEAVLPEVVEVGVYDLSELDGRGQGEKRVECAEGIPAGSEIRLERERRRLNLPAIQGVEEE